jgi:hypothetical protein
VGVLSVKRKALNSPKEQLGLWVEMEEIPSQPNQGEPAPLEEERWQQIQRTSTPTEADIQAMRVWLMAWGERNGYPAFGFPFHYPPRNEDTDRRFGLLSWGKDQWEQKIQSPHAQWECYPGEWLIRAIEHVKRFESGVHSMPWKEFPRNETTTSHQTRDEEESVIDLEWKRPALMDWLSTWAHEHRFTTLTFTLFDGKRGYTGRAGPGEESWALFFAMADIDMLMRARMAAEVRKEHWYRLHLVKLGQARNWGPFRFVANIYGQDTTFFIGPDEYHWREFAANGIAQQVMWACDALGCEQEV